MTLEEGNIWSVLGETPLLLFTANSTRRKDGAVVMGRGFAREVKERIPLLPHELGARIRMRRLYGLVVLTPYFCNGVKQDIGAFQVKYHFREVARLSLIGCSIAMLVEHIRKRRLTRVDMNYPGIGNGQLLYKDVQPLMYELPDLVHVWVRSYKEVQ